MLKLAVHKPFSYLVPVNGVIWGYENLALIYERWWQNRQIRVWQIDPGNPDSEPKLTLDYSWQDRYNNPGSPLVQQNEMGHAVLLTDDSGSNIYLTGPGGSPEGDRPFLDMLNLKSKKTKRLWRSNAPYYESAVRLVDKKKIKLLTRRESKTEPPNYFLRDLSTDKIVQVTQFPHPTLELAKFAMLAKTALT
jgi:dipeptidyl aminopeptidase/acylaminoacyl peptidase